MNGVLTIHHGKRHQKSFLILNLSTYVTLKYATLTVQASEALDERQICICDLASGRPRAPL
eukprot:6185119-Pleurochrysis_carterae.AAC.3